MRLIPSYLTSFNCWRLSALGLQSILYECSRRSLDVFVVQNTFMDFEDVWTAGDFIAFHSGSSKLSGGVLFINHSRIAVKSQINFTPYVRGRLVVARIRTEY